MHEFSASSDEKDALLVWKVPCGFVENDVHMYMFNVLNVSSKLVLPREIRFCDSAIASPSEQLVLAIGGLCQNFPT